MKLVASNLVLEDVYILESSFVFVPGDDFDQVDLKAIPVEIGLDIALEPDLNEFRVELKLEGNRGKVKKPGYSFKIISEHIFSFKQLGSTEKETVGQLILSGVPAAVDFIRGYLTVMSATFPYGQYLLPTVDLQQLFENYIEKEFGKVKKTSRKSKKA